MIYLVEDNQGIRETIKAYLELADYTVEEFGQVANVVESLVYKQPELVILDIMLPDGNGFELAKQIRQHNPAIPFLFLTAREAESDRITGLELGGEDYIVKPFSPRELVLRVQAILRRVQKSLKGEEEGIRYKLGEHTMMLDEHKHEVSVDAQHVSLTALEWKMLFFLSSNAKTLITRQRLLGECLGYLHDGSDRTINTHMKNLRSKLGNAEWIKTVRGFGYSFSGEREKP